MGSGTIDPGRRPVCPTIIAFAWERNEVTPSHPHRSESARTPPRTPTTPGRRAEVCTTQGDKDTVWHPFRVFGPYSFDTQQPSSN
jgi:hypothetical protein